MKLKRQSGYHIQALCGAALIGMICAVAVPAVSQDSVHNVVLDPGTVLAGHLSTELSSKNSQIGDHFTVTVQDSDIQGPMSSDALPVGTEIEGVVRDVQPKQGKHPGMIDLAFKRVILPDSNAHKIEGSLIGLDNKSVYRTPGGRLVATKDHSNNRLTYVGIGAGVGAIVGMASKSPVRDTLFGASLGFLAGAFAKHSSVRDIDLKPGTRIGIRLDNSLTYAVR